MKPRTTTTRLAYGKGRSMASETSEARFERLALKGLRCLCSDCCRRDPRRLKYRTWGGTKV